MRERPFSVLANFGLLWYGYFMELCAQAITYVEPESPAARCGIRAGDALLAINGEPVKDLIDYEKLTAERILHIDICRGGETLSYRIRKDEYEPLGLNFETSLMSRMQTCKNHCMFCFIDQMPRGVRSSLQVKDDDWRMSFIMGNYVTLTNVDDEEFDRILRRGISPLYVSVHAIDPKVRTRIMKNPTAGRIRERLEALKAAGLRFHAQIVLCPGINDGDVLEETLTVLGELAPACASVAIVPVGITRFREKLEHLDTFDQLGSLLVIRQVERFQKRFWERLGTRLVFLSDEWYLNANLSIPEEAYYEDFGQIENGVGLLRLFAMDFKAALADQKPLSKPRSFSMAGGTAANPFFVDLYRVLEPYNIRLDIHAIPNRYFGGNVHVAGLVTGQDIVAELGDKPLCKTLLIPHNMLREQEDVFLDGMTVRELETKLSVSVRPFGDGADLIAKLFEVKDE